MNKGGLFLRKHSSTILTCLGAAGVVGTAVLAVKATPKALKLIENERQARKQYSTIFADNEPYETVIIPDLKPLEIVKIAWKPYIPAVITGISTIACIFGANALNKRQQASLMSAYMMLDRTFKEYRRKTKELYPEESHIFEHEIIKSKYNHDIDLNEDEELFFDYQSMEYFGSTFEEMDEAEAILNQKLNMDGMACLNDLYDILGLKHVPYGYQLGWTTMTNDKIYGHAPLKFNYEKTIIEDGSEDGVECNIMTINYPPELEYIC